MNFVTLLYALSAEFEDLAFYTFAILLGALSDHGLEIQ